MAEVVQGHMGSCGGGVGLAGRLWGARTRKASQFMIDLAINEYLSS